MITTARMASPHYGRRTFMVAAATGATAVALISGGLVLSDAGERSRYRRAVDAIWRHSVDFDLPADQARRELARYAVLAANSHNTQPWRFLLTDGAIELHPDAARRLPAVDPDDHHLFASLGHAVENIAQAAPAFGLRAVPGFDSARKVDRVTLEAGPRAKSALFDAIPRRQSTRAPYDGRPVAPEELALLDAAGQGAGVQALIFTQAKQREAILAYLIAANGAQMDDTTFVTELESWIRFGYMDALATGDGLFAACSGQPTVPRVIGRPIFPMVFRKDAGTRKYQAHLRTAAGVVVFVSDRNEPAGWVEAGRACQRFALQATALGLRTAYINQPVEVPSVRGQFAAWLGVGDRRPDLAMRFGYGPPLPRPIRRPMGQVIARG